ncbi:MAG: mechanosensitive ion channel [Thermoanaerobaculia bacterium]|nr:mechanosensitive ion channel [Thermoanaerobaculia bacterium]
MSWKTVLDWLRSALGTDLFRIAETDINGATLLTFAAIVVVTFWMARVVQRGVERVLARRGGDEGSIGVVSRLVRYAALVVGLSIGLNSIGINLNALFAAGALFAVAIGFAMQNVVANFVSGVILLAERVIKPGDILFVEGQMVRVSDMGIRATIVRTLDEESIVIPNAVLVQSSVKNYTLEDWLYRVRVEVGVSYDADLKLVRQVLEEVSANQAWASDVRQPVVYLSQFGDSSVVFEVSLWVQDPWTSRRAGSDLREAIWWAFKRASITIAYPQLDVHFDPPSPALLPSGDTSSEKRGSDEERRLSDESATANPSA